MNEQDARIAPLERQKRWAPRSRTGCLTCRTRRIKCDEERPVLPVVEASLCPTPVKPTTAELALSHYFKINITPFSADEFLEPFWSYSVPLATHSLRPLFHASNAVAGLVWSRTPAAKLSPVATTEIYSESARQYSESTKQILKITQVPSPSAEDKTTVLLANVLLILYALEIGDADGVASINNRSWQLIRYWRFWECIAASGIGDMATQVLYFFIRASSFQTSQTHRGRKVAEAWGDAIEWLQQSPLTSTTRAYLELEMIWIGIWAITSNFQQRKIDLETAQHGHATLVEQLSIWDSRYLAMPYSMLLTTPIHATVLASQRILINIQLQVTSTHFEEVWQETCWDRFHGEHLRVLRIIESGLGQDDKEDHENGEKWMQVETGFTQSLYKALNSIAKSCRSPRTRRRAAATLKAAIRHGLSKLPIKSRIGLTRYCAIYFLVDDIILLEECAWTDPSLRDGCTDSNKCIKGEYICSRHRVTSVEMVRREGRPPEIRAVTVGDILDNTPGQILTPPAVNVGQN
ncbi:hypothetical protein NLG97_g1363 [Lecanicillium saksenae]|uniref:Uncharacterized protein n=1 Tax=Lecanicillium saksenae TaxID=468837 RepID=A0ACC1R5W1_9HYPO|nr:hypothetical protein NLG97_g1363 [Lecanicillium saksenae]